jgi:hypothetical protein
VPWLEVFRRSEEVLSPPVYAGAIVAVAGALIARERERAWTLRLGLALSAAALMVVVAAMTQAGFAGNLRYVALPASVVCVLAGVGWVDVVRWLGRRSRGVLGVAAAAALLVWWQPYVSREWDAVNVTWEQVRRDAGADRDLAHAVAAAGGAAAILRCGPVYTGPFHTPAVAWVLGIHLDEVRIFPTPPGTVIAGRRSWLARDPRFKPVVATAEWRVLHSCRPG